MMRTLNDLIGNNRAWAARVVQKDPSFFRRLVDQQRPEYLWIGCSDSRVPANEIVGLLPGELFVHRNVANMVYPIDLNCLSVLQYALEVLQVRHIIVCGHYGCGGVLSALRGQRLGLIDNWLRGVREIRDYDRARLDMLSTEEERHDRLCELNVIQQVAHVCRTTVVQEAWSRGAAFSVHGWIYGVEDGLVKDLTMSVAAPGELDERFEAARSRPGARTAR